MEPSTVIGPTQKTRLAVTKPSLKREPPPVAKRFWRLSPSASRRRASPSAWPARPPARMAARSTISLAVPIAIFVPMTSVRRPSPERTRLRALSGMRLPPAMPMAAPATTAAAFTNVPVTTCPLLSPGPGSAPRPCLGPAPDSS